MGKVANDQEEVKEQANEIKITEEDVAVDTMADNEELVEKESDFMQLGQVNQKSFKTSKGDEIPADQIEILDSQNTEQEEDRHSTERALGRENTDHLVSSNSSSKSKSFTKQLESSQREQINLQKNKNNGLSLTSIVKQTEDDILDIVSNNEDD